MTETRVLTVFGTRPEAIKMAPLVKEFAKHAQFNARVAVTAQHREMLDQVLELFSIKPHYDLDIMEKGQNLEDIIYKVLVGLGEVLSDFQPHLVMVHGDTATTFAGALAAFYKKIPVGHVEAGLRTADKYQPFPEEMNRCLTGTLADYHFAPTRGAAENLLRENIAQDRIVVTGNTVIDALLTALKEPHSFAGTALSDLDLTNGPSILLTAHRRENWGEPLREIAQSILDLVETHQDLQVVYPVHLNELVRNIVWPILSDHPRIHLIEPLDYLSFCHLMQKVTLILTDSGGIQEEGPALGKPVLVLRSQTERPEAVQAGTVKLLGHQKGVIHKEVSALLTNQDLYTSMAQAKNPYGDGQASRKIIDYLKGIIW